MADGHNFCQESVRKKSEKGQATLAIVVYYICMTDRGIPTPQIAAESGQTPGLRRLGVGDTLPAGVATLIALEIRNRRQAEAKKALEGGDSTSLGGSGQAGSGFGEARPIRAQGFVEPTPIFISPGTLGEVRI